MKNMKEFVDWLRGPFMKDGSAAEIPEYEDVRDVFRQAGEKARQYADMAEDKVRFANARAAAVELEAKKLISDMDAFYKAIIEKHMDRCLMLEEENRRIKAKLSSV